MSNPQPYPGPCAEGLIDAREIAINTISVSVECHCPCAFGGGSGDYTLTLSMDRSHLAPLNAPPDGQFSIFKSGCCGNLPVIAPTGYFVPGSAPNECLGGTMEANISLNPNIYRNEDGELRLTLYAGIVYVAGVTASADLPIDGGSDVTVVRIQITDDPARDYVFTFTFTAS